MIAGVLEVQMMANMARLQADMDTAKRSVVGTMANIESAVGSAKSVLASLGIGIGVGYFVNLINGSIDAADHLNDLSKSTNIAVGDLAGLKLLAKQTGTDLDGLAGGILKMSVAMGKDPEKFKALGVTSKDNTEAFKQLADIFNLLPDIQQRNALSAAVFGKTWKEMASALSEGGQKIGETIDKGRRLSGITAETTKAADEFNDKWVELTGTGGLLTRQIAPLLPLLNTLADDMITAQNKSTDLTSEFHPLAEAFRAVVILGGNVAFVFKGMGAEAGGLAAQINALAHGNLAAFTAIGEEMKKDAADRRVAFDEWEKKILAVGTAAKTTLPAVGAATSQVTDAQKKAAAAAAKFLETQKELTDAYKTLKKSLVEKIAAQEAELASDEKLNAAQKEYAQFLASIVAGTLVLTDAAMKDAVAKWDQYLALSKLNEEKQRWQKLEDDAGARWAASYDATAKATQATIDGTKAMRDNTAEMGLSEDSLLALKQARIDDEIAAQQRMLAILTTNDIESENTRAIRENIVALEDRRKAMGEAKERSEQVALWKTVEQAGHDAFMHIGEGGKSVLDRLKQTLQNGLLELLYQMTMKKWIVTIQENVISSGAGSAGGGGLGGLFGSIGEFFGGGSGAASAASETAAMSAWASLDGGGYTGDGPRTGGVDGKGGFPAIIHPQESWTDHTKGGSSAGGGDTSISMPVSLTINGNADNQVVQQLLAGFDSRIRQVYRDIPAVIRQAQISKRVSPTV